MTIDDAKLMAFVDGELSAAERDEVEAAVAADAELRAKLAAHQRLRTRLSAAFDGALDEPLPARLLEATQKEPQPAKVVNLAERRAARRWAGREWGAMAASLVLGLLVGLGVTRTQTPLIEPTEGGLAARGALSRALETQLASDDASIVRIGLTFRNEEGAFCRTFDLTRAATAGLACRGDDGWSVEMTAAGAGGGEVRMAGASEEILAAVEASIAGDPLGADAERAARDAGWR